MRTPETFAGDVTIVYSKNNCPKCRMTKKNLERHGIKFEEVNIETIGDASRSEYATFLKGEKETLTMPVVYPAAQTGLERWNDFQDSKIKELAQALK